MVPMPLSSTPSDVPSWGGIVLGYDPNEKDIAVSTPSAATNFGRDRSSTNAIGRRRPTREVTRSSDGSTSASTSTSASSLPPFVSFRSFGSVSAAASSFSSPAGRSSAATKSPVTSPTRRATTAARGTSAATISATNARAAATLPSSAFC